MSRLIEKELIDQFLRIGICSGDVILIRASIGSVGRIEGGADSFINALLNVVGSEGTIVSLAFTNSTFLKKPNISDAFDLKKESYAGALPNAMIRQKDAFRSRHPTCSYVAIGKFAKEITEDHDENSLAYEPIRKIINLSGKCMLVGCVGSSPGFTTAHLAEADLGMSSLAIFPKLKSVYYRGENGETHLFRRKDPGLCSNSFSKFYAFYVEKEILKVGFIGRAYSILATAKECYDIEYEILSKNKKFNICGSADCFTCNAGRWDRIHHAPKYFLRLLARRINKRAARKNAGRLP